VFKRSRTARRQHEGSPNGSSSAAGSCSRVSFLHKEKKDQSNILKDKEKEERERNKRGWGKIKEVVNKRKKRMKVDR
jgi:hypothetical protein